MPVAAIALSLFVEAARALPAAGVGDGYEMVYRAADGCPDGASLRADLAAQIHDRARASGARIEIAIRPERGGLSGVVEIENRAGNRYRRVVAGRDCPEVAHALAFLAGLAFDLSPDQLTSDQADGIDPALATTRPPRPTPAAMSSAPPARRAFAVAAHAMGELRGGLGGGARAAGQIGLAIEDPRARSFAPAVGLALVGGGGETTGRRGSADLWLLGGRLSFCPLRGSWSAFEVRPCAAAELGTVWAHATSLINAPSVRRLWASADAGMDLRWLVAGALFAEVQVGAMFPWVRPRYTFQFQPGQPLVAVPAVTARLSVGVGYRF